jgi:hypothetical protein
MQRDHFYSLHHNLNTADNNNNVIGHHVDGKGSVALFNQPVALALLHSFYDDNGDIKTPVDSKDDNGDTVAPATSSRPSKKETKPTPSLRNRENRSSSKSDDDHQHLPSFDGRIRQLVIGDCGNHTLRIVTIPREWPITDTTTT